MPAWEGVSTVFDQANATMKAIARAPSEKASLRIVGSFVDEFDAGRMHASCFRSLPSQATNGVVAGFVGFAGSRTKKRLHEFGRKGWLTPNSGDQQN
jgi:hypothetical protein